MKANGVEMVAGVEPGLRFAALLDGQGGSRELDWQGVEKWRPEDGFLWIHLERDDERAAIWLQQRCEIDPLLAEALLAEESRPRIETEDAGTLIVLRGVNLIATDELELVPIHIWVDQNRLISLRDKHHALNALRDIRLALKAGRGPRQPGSLLALITEKIVRDMEPYLDELDAEVEQLEDQVLDKASHNLRPTLANIRRRAIHLRRYLGPQREALYHLRHEDVLVFSDRDRLRLRSVIDRLSRYIEDMDAIRDRTSLLYEDLSALISERIARTSHRFTAIAGLLLPPSLVAGMLGTNIGGIPGQSDPWAFLVLTAIIVVLLVLQYFLLRRIRWL